LHANLKMDWCAAQETENSQVPLHFGRIRVNTWNSPTWWKNRPLNLISVHNLTFKLLHLSMKYIILLVGTLCLLFVARVDAGFYTPWNYLRAETTGALEKSTLALQRISLLSSTGANVTTKTLNLKNMEDVLSIMGQIIKNCTDLQDPQLIEGSKNLRETFLAVKDKFLEKGMTKIILIDLGAARKRLGQFRKSVQHQSATASDSFFLTLLFCMVAIAVETLIKRPNIDLYKKLSTKDLRASLWNLFLLVPPVLIAFADTPVPAAFAREAHFPQYLNQGMLAATLLLLAATGVVVYQNREALTERCTLATAALKQSPAVRGGTKFGVIVLLLVALMSSYCTLQSAFTSLMELPSPVLNLFSSSAAASSSSSSSSAASSSASSSSSAAAGAAGAGGRGRASFVGLALWGQHAQAPVYRSGNLGTRVQYFRTTAAEGMSAAPLLTLTEPLVYLSRSDVPHPALGPTFSAVYEGYLLAPEVSGSVSFHVRTNAHVRFEINGRLCINEKYDAARQPYKCYEHLEAGSKYPYKVTYLTQLVDNSSSAADAANAAEAATATTADDDDRVFKDKGSGSGMGGGSVGGSGSIVSSGSALYFLELKWVKSSCPEGDSTCLEGELIPQGNLLLE
jgi:hypothetical protein